MWLKSQCCGHYICQFKMSAIISWSTANIQTYSVSILVYIVTTSHFCNIIILRLPQISIFASLTCPWLDWNLTYNIHNRESCGCYRLDSSWPIAKFTAQCQSCGSSTTHKPVMSEHKQWHAHCIISPGFPMLRNILSNHCVGCYNLTDLFHSNSKHVSLRKVAYCEILRHFILLRKCSFMNLFK